MVISSKGWVRFRAKETCLYALDATRRLADDQIRVAIFAQGRTGSTLLENLLGATGHFATQGELLSCDEHEVRRPLAFVRAAAKRARGGNCTFHVKVYHLSRDRRRPIDPAAFLRDLHGSGWRIVHLVRRDIVKHALSTLVAEARGDFHRFHDRPEKLRIDVDPANFRRLLEERKQFARDEREALDKLPRIPVSYEDDLVDQSRHQATVDRILAELGLERRPVRAETRKVNRFAPRDLIRNFDEIDAIARAEGMTLEEDALSAPEPRREALPVGTSS